MNNTVMADVEVIDPCNKIPLGMARVISWQPKDQGYHYEVIGHGYVRGGKVYVGVCGAEEDDWVVPVFRISGGLYVEKRFVLEPKKAKQRAV